MRKEMPSPKGEPREASTPHFFRVSDAVGVEELHYLPSEVV